MQAIAERIAGKSPLGLARMKMLLNDGQDMPAALAMKTEKLVSAQHMRSEDAVEGERTSSVDAFDAGMCVGASENEAVKHAGHVHIRAETGLPGHLVDAVGT